MKWFKKILRKILDAVTFRSKEFDPEKDWKIIFFISVFFFLISLLFHLVFFYRVENESIFRSNILPTEDTIELDIIKLDQTFDFFEAKSLRFEAIRKNGLNTIDPSI